MLIGQDKFEDFKQYLSYQDAVGLDEIPIEFEWKFFQELLGKKGLEP